MKKIIASASLVAVGTAGLQAADNYFGLSRTEATKNWSVAASLRGFYDDNYATSPSGAEDDSFGFEISPALRYNLPLEQTYFGLGYTYSFKYFEGREDNKDDQSHQADLAFEHRFSERYRVNLDDSFVYSEEPAIVEQGGTITAPIARRAKSDAFRNRGSVSATGQFTELLGLQVGYRNLWYDYLEDSGDRAKLMAPLVGPNNGGGSLSARLDRFEHYVNVDGRYTIQPQLIGILGYQFGMIDYTSDEPLYLGAPGFVGPTGDIRDSKSHYIYVGAEKTFTPQLTVAARAGAQYVTYDNLSGQDDWFPYADLTASYVYLPGSSVQVGFRQTVSPTDVVIANLAGTPTTDAMSSTFFGAISHRISQPLTARAIGQYQFMNFTNGAVDGEVDNLFLVGLVVEYRFNENLAVETGYNFDRLDSDLAARSFSRNRIYVGVRASY